MLAALPDAAYLRLLPDLEAVVLEPGETLFHPTGRLQTAYFPIDSIVTLSYALEEGGAMAKAWPVGCEGMIGISIFLDGPKQSNQADVQIAGKAVSLPAAVLLKEYQRVGAFQQLLSRYVFALVTQASQLSVCNHYHTLEQRLCRFLARLFDRMSAEQIALTQEHIGALLGTRRESITQAASRLQSEGIIAYERGHIRLLSRAKLDEHSCCCGAIIRQAFESVFE